jgi:diguanylate cyclase (GGDEF)-like protein
LVIEYRSTDQNKVSDQTPGLIMLIDDDEDVLYSLQDLLELEGGYKVETAVDAKSAILKSEQISPDLALIDIRLGRSSGLELISHIKHRVPGINCIMMTAYRDVDYAVKALRAGADDYLFKPIDPDRLLTVVGEKLQQRRINEVKATNERNITNILEHASGFIFILSPKGLCIEAGYAALSFIDGVWGEIKGKIFSQTPWCLNSNIDTGQIDEAVEGAAAGSPTTFEAELVNKKGEYVWYEFSLKPVFENENQVSLIIVEGRDLTKFKKIEQNLKKLTFFDPLTGLANRTLLNEHLEIALARGARNSRRFAVMFIDLDNFKSVNDTLGHQAGDELLANVGQCLKTCLRDEDIIARVGGDEFVVVVSSESNKKGTEKVARRLIKSIAALDYKTGDGDIVSASIGVAIFPENGDDVETILKNADAAMYTAKRNGKNRLHYFDNE